MRVDSCRVLGVVAVLGLTAMAPAPASAHSPQPTSAKAAKVPESGRIVVVGKEFQFMPDAIRVEKGQEVTVVFRNEGQLSHNLTIPDLGLNTATIQTGAQDTLHFTAKEAGAYPFWCTVPGHKEAGMKGKVDVSQ